jgi:hypothetical protein
MPSEKEKSKQAVNGAKVFVGFDFLNRHKKAICLDKIWFPAMAKPKVPTLQQWLREAAIADH